MRPRLLISISPPSLHIISAAVVIPVNIVHSLTFMRVASRIRVLLARLVVLFLVLLCLLGALGGLALAEAIADRVSLVCGSQKAK